MNDVQSVSGEFKTNPTKNADNQESNSNLSHQAKTSQCCNCKLFLKLIVVKLISAAIYIVSRIIHSYFSNESLDHFLDIFASNHANGSSHSYLYLCFLFLYNFS